MNKGISLQALAAEIERQDDAKHDMIADTGAVTMHDMEGAFSLAVADEDFGINQTAHSQIAARLGIPLKYYDRMQAEAPSMLSYNVNEWFRRKPERRMIRTLDGNVRAFLSDRYQRIDNWDISKAALPVLAKIPELKIVSSQITEHRMYIQAVTARLTENVALNDAVQAGVIISNSEIGMGSVSVAPIVYRLKCLNGMVIADQKYRAMHVGRRIEDSAELWADDTRQADDRAVLLKVRDMIAKAVDAVNFRENVERMQGLVRESVTGNPIKVVEVLSKRLGITEAEQGGILRSLIEGGDLCRRGACSTRSPPRPTAPSTIVRSSSRRPAASS
jgi:hypothetical protein